MNPELLIILKALIVYDLCKITIQLFIFMITPMKIKFKKEDLDE